MRIKSLFNVLDGENVTEKALRKVLVSSICSILLCMACLVGTTWAWFVVSIENTGNVIQIATVSETVIVTDMRSEKVVDPANGVYHLANGQYSVQVQLTSDATEQDDLNKQKTPVYVLMSIAYAGAENDVEYYYLPFDSGAGKAEQTLEIYCTSAVLRFSVTWVKPAEAIQIGNEAVIIGEKPTDPTEMPTTIPEGTDETTVPSTTEPATLPEESAANATTEPPTMPPETTAPMGSD